MSAGRRGLCSRGGAAEGGEVRGEREGAEAGAGAACMMTQSWVYSDDEEWTIGECRSREMCGQIRGCRSKPRGGGGGDSLISLSTAVSSLHPGIVGRE